MRLVFVLIFAVLIAGAGSPKPASLSEGMDEVINSLKERCNMRHGHTRFSLWRRVLGQANCSGRSREPRPIRVTPWREMPVPDIRFTPWREIPARVRKVELPAACDRGNF